MAPELMAVRQDCCDEIDPYERLLTDAMHGDALLFVRSDAVEADLDRILWGDRCMGLSYLFIIQLEFSPKRRARA